MTDTQTYAQVVEKLIMADPAELHRYCQEYDINGDGDEHFLLLGLSSVFSEPFFDKSVVAAIVSRTEDDTMTDISFYNDSAHAKRAWEMR